MTKKDFGDYYLGLDIGTDSVGWAVTDRRYEILRFNGKAMWGIHLFNEGSTAEERRMHRISRRRLQRRNERLALLRELMGAEVALADPGFYARMDESFLHRDDRNEDQPNSIFNDPCFKDCDYHKKFPTVYHLRKYLMTTDEKPDIRLVYLAAHHILKHRGHFLFEGLGDGGVPEFEPLFEELLGLVRTELGTDISVSENTSAIKAILTDRNMSTTEKKATLTELMGASDKPAKAFAAILSGATVKLSDLFSESGLDFESDEMKDFGKVSFRESKFEEEHEGYENALGSDNMLVLDLMKQVFDWGVLSSILKGCSGISEANIEVYESHKKDLFLLKSILKSYAVEHGNDYSLYRAVFKSDEKNNYCSYSRKAYNRRNRSELAKTSQAEFCEFLAKKLKDVDFETCDAYRDMKNRIIAGTFMPKPRSKDNSLFPNALHTKELRAIMDNAARFYPSFHEMDSKGVTVADKVVMLSTFRIPYYVGPLGRNSATGWVSRKGDGRVLPWNFEEKVDIEESARRFIDNMVSTCTYIRGEKVLPANSPYYVRFKLLNELNNISVNGSRITQEDKSAILREYYEAANMTNVSVKALESYFSRKYGEKPTVGGIDVTIKSNLRAEHQLSDILGDLKKCRAMSEEIASILTIYGDDPSMMKRKLSSEYGKVLSKDQIARLSSIKFRDWGKLSSRFLTDIYHKFPDGVERNILGALTDLPLNLMELLSDRYTYTRQIEKINSSVSEEGGEITYDDVDDLYCSPAVKHAIWRTLRVVREILKITGHAPAKVFIETTREKADDGKKMSRKFQLLERYRSAELKGTYSELLGSLEGTDEPRLRSKKLFAYYSQLGRCMYCGKHIDLNDLANNNLYDMDHIHPQSKKTDDSQSNNMVLACRSCNFSKTDVYPIAPSVQQTMGPFWLMLKNNKLITSEKYERLVRRTPFTEDELGNFIARQLVETSQSVKAVAKILERCFNGQSDIVYVKGSNVSRFRHDNAQLTDGGGDKGWYVKCRNVNDYHHAKDAYLNIVVGNVYDVKFTKDPVRFVRSQTKYNLNRMFDFMVEQGDVVAWIPGPEGSISVVDKNMRRNNILFTRAPFKESGQLFDVNILKKTKGQLPFKQGMDTEKYGAYNKLTGAYYALVEHTVKGKRVRSIETVPLTVSKRLGADGLNGFFSQDMEEPVVLIPQILVDTMLEIDGFRTFLRSRSGDSYILINAEQLELPYAACRYCKKLFNYADALKTNRKASPSDFGLDAEGNNELYSILVSKLEGPYSKNSTYGNVKGALDKLDMPFQDRDLAAQASILNNLLKAFQCNALYPNFKEFGGPGLTGRPSMNKNLNNCGEIFIINQSVTGLFEQKVDLKRI